MHGGGCGGLHRGYAAGGDGDGGVSAGEEQLSRVEGAGGGSD